MNNWSEVFNVFYQLFQFDYERPYLLFLIPLTLSIFFFPRKFKYTSNSYKSKRYTRSKQILVSALSQLPKVLISLALIFGLIALAGPKSKSISFLKNTSGISIMIAIDISESMLLEDFDPNRLNVAKEVASYFIEGRKNDQIGVVAFSGQAYTVCPLTTDYKVINGMIADLKTTDIKEGGTSLASAILLLAKRLSSVKTTSKIGILISDGENTFNTLSLDNSLRLAIENNIKIYTIGVGNDGLAPFGYDNKNNQIYYESHLDEENLKFIAEQTNAKYYRATSKNYLIDIMNEINQLEKSDLSPSFIVQHDYHYHVFILWSIICLLIIQLLRLTPFFPYVFD